MLERMRDWAVAQLRAAKPSFISRSPHFNFISAHYFWIIGLTILGSVLIYSTAEGKLAYIDALFFASGANTQAGLNTVDVNSLTTFAQVCIFIFTMTSNPITIHSSVVLLRLYWFEKHFQDLVKGARARRVTMSKSRLKGNDDSNHAERGVAGKHITVMPNSGSRITNDGILLDRKENNDGRTSPGSTGTAVPSSEADERRADENIHPAEPTPAQISFARTVTLSDGGGTQRTKFATHPALQHPTPLRKRRDSNRDEILRIPNPRDYDKGLGPRRIQEGDAPEVDDDEDQNQPGMRSPPHSKPNTPPNPIANPPPDVGHTRQRNPTITIAEPAKPSEQEREQPVKNGNPNKAKPESDTMDELAQDATALGNVLELFKIRKPRIFQGENQRHHVDSDEELDEDDPRRHHRVRRRTFDVIKGALSSDKVQQAPYLSWTPTLGRNSQFPGLTMEQREELGGIEYRSLRTLAIILFFYFWGFWIFSVLCLLPWILTPSNNSYAEVVDDAGVARSWWGFFTANSAFLDLGLTLTPNSMMSFAESQYILMIMSFLIIAGNTGFPVLLRGTIWVLAHLVPKKSGLWEELRFLLDHPRRCFTLLFPAGATWWLFWILVGLNALDLIFFIALDLNNPVVTDLPVHLRVVNGLFQATCTRTAGFSSVNLAELHPAVQVSYMMMMYISVFPIAISIRRTNVYEEKSLGVYSTPDEADDPNENSGMSYVGSHLRRQLSFDLWYVFLGLFILCITEGPKIQQNLFDPFSVLFEIISAYGTVGLSLGFPGVNASLSSQFTVVGKLVIIAMQIRGRHRGLPYGLDRAVLLPSAKRFEEEAMEAQSMLTRQPTHLTQATVGTASGTDAALRRGRSRDRGIITSFLHPGPPVARQRTMSHNSRRVSIDFGSFHPDGDELRRRHTEPPDEEAISDDEDFTARARRVQTTPAT